MSEQALFAPSPSPTTTATITRMESIKRQLLTGHRPRNLRIDATALELATRKTSRPDMVSEHGNWPHAACRMPHAAWQSTCAAVAETIRTNGPP